MTRNKLFASGLVLVGLVTAAVSAVAHEHASPTDAQEHRLAQIKAWFEPDAIVSVPTVVDCTLSGGSKSKCFAITLKVEPVGYKPGPWCPRNISDGPEKSGIWLDKGNVHAADGPFIANLKTFYKDDTWQMYDPATGDVKVSSTKESCQGAARPDVDPKYVNHCVECQTSYMPADSTMSFVLPIEPVILSGSPQTIDRHGGVGVSLSGPRYDAPAPVDAILGAHTLAPFDKCGGHVNLHVGYHIHAVTDCVKKVATTDQEQAPLIGIAMDGFPIAARVNSEGTEPSDLDSCRGHASGELGYHYHVAEPGQNAILSCLKAETGCAFEGAAQSCDASTWGGIWRTIRQWVGGK